MPTSTASLRCALPLVFLAFFGCSASPGQTPAAPPAPFLVQFADTYDVRAPSKTGIETLTLDPHGTYEATLAHGVTESGTYASTDGPTLPVTAELTDGAKTWSFQITTAEGDMTITREGLKDTARPQHTVGPNESLCDATGGTWRDDDSKGDGLYCACPARTRYVPSRGGCVTDADAPAR